MIDALPSPHAWIKAALEASTAKQRAVLALVSKEKGSTPRDVGSWILVSEEKILGTVGGGEFERTMIEAAQAMLSGDGNWRRSFLDTVLGPDMRQCCGGVMQLMLQPIDQGSCEWLTTAAQQMEQDQAVRVSFSRAEPGEVPLVMTSDVTTPGLETECFMLSIHDDYPKIALFGAGHVGRALCTIASQLPIRVSVFDSRSEQCALLPAAQNIVLDSSLDPLSRARSLKNFDGAIVMTHSHELDFSLCETLLQNTALKYIGLIGSESKSHRFRKRLLQSSVHKAQVDRLVSPIGRDGPAGKEPGLIALAVLNELMTTLRPSQDIQTVHLMKQPAA